MIYQVKASVVLKHLELSSLCFDVSKQNVAQCTCHSYCCYYGTSVAVMHQLTRMTHGRARTTAKTTNVSKLLLCPRP